MSPISLFAAWSTTVARIIGLRYASSVALPMILPTMP